MAESIDIESFLAEESKGINKEIEKVLPKHASADWVQKTFGKARYAYDTNSIEKALLVPIWDLLDRGGKRWRPALMILSCESVGGKREQAVPFVALPEIIHNGTLVHDDIEDNSELRRGKACVHKIYGIDIAINTGSAMYFLPQAILRDQTKGFSAEKRGLMYETVYQELLNCHIGQALDIYWHNGKKEDISESEYLQMCAYKTGTLARLSAKLGVILGNGSKEQLEALGKFGETIGVAFQIQDDILNLVGEKFAKGKGVGEDIHEGKRTLMVLHTLGKATPTEKRKLLDLLNSHTNDEAKIHEAIAIIEKNGGIDYARRKAKEIVQNSWMEVDRTLQESRAKQMSKAFANYLIERDI